MTVKIKEIAKSMNISPTTVSLILNNRPGVGAETRERVLNYINENGLNVNTRKSAASGRSIGFFIYKKHGKVVSDTPFFSQVIEGIESEARKNGYNLSISYLKASPKGSQLANFLGQGLPGGVILLATEMDENDLTDFEQLNVPMVILDNCFADDHVDAVYIGNERGSSEAVSYLIHAGHREVGYLHSAVPITNFDCRSRGYRHALEAAGLPVKEDNIFLLDSTVDGACSDMKKYLEAGRRLPTAFFADNDLIAIGAMKALKEAGLRIPEDISIIGFDDMPYCAMAEPPLSTVQVYKQYMGEMAVRRLVEKMESTDSEGEYLKAEVGTQLVLRASVGAPAEPAAK